MKLIRIWHLIFERRFIFLTVFSLLYIILPPFLMDFPFLSLLIVVLYTIVLAFCLVIITGHDKPKPFHFVFIVILIIPFLQIEHSYYNTALFLIIGSIYGWAAFKIIFQILKIKNVNAEVILGAVGGYLLIGLSCSFFVSFFSTIDPMAFNFPVESESIYQEVYYTFVTLTTLGYGDITPKSPQAQSISILIALVGQIYLTILMAILVGKYLFTLGASKKS